MSYLFDQERLQTLNLLLCSKTDDLFSQLDISLCKSSKLYCGACQVHGGDNETALNVYPLPKGHSPPGYWRCNTRKCQDFFKKTMIGFVRGILSHKKYDWTCPKDKYTFPFADTIKWCCDFVGQAWRHLRFTDKDIENSQFLQQSKILFQEARNKVKSLVTRTELRRRLKFPAKYFVDRGFSEGVLDQHDVGLCYTKTKPMYFRAVVPIYDAEGDYVGCTGRSLYKQCDKCGLFHPDLIPCKDLFCKNYWCKWRNSKFEKEYILYNINLALTEVEKTGKLYIVEGPGDSWKLEMAGFPNSVALLGSSMSDSQQILIEKSPATELIILGDNDAAGAKMREDCYRRFKHLYKLRFPEFKGHDIGGLSVDEIKQCLV